MIAAPQLHNPAEAGVAELLPAYRLWPASAGYLSRPAD
jgi:hypothetical protein